MRVKVKFYVPESVCFGHLSGGYAKTIIVDCESYDEAFVKACEAGGDPNHLMRYTLLEE